MKKKFLSLLVSVMTMMNFTVGGYSATAIENTATEANLKAALAYWTDFHSSWLTSVKASLDGDMDAIPKFLEAYIVADGVFRDEFLFAPDASIYYSTLVSSRVFEETKALLGLTGFAKGEIDTGTITLSDGSTMRVSMILNKPSTGLAKGSKNHRDHYEDIITVTKTSVDGTTQFLSVTARTFVDTLGGNDLNMSYTAKTAANLTLSTASVEGYVAASNAVIYKSTFTKPVYTAANTVAGTRTYTNSNSAGYTLADTASIAHYLGATGVTASSLDYARAATCPPAPPCNNLISVTNADGQPVHTVAIGDTVTIKADFSTIDGVKSVFVVAFPLVEGNDDPGTIGAVNGSVFEQTITIPATASVGQVILMAAAFDAEYVIGKDGEPSPAGRLLKSATYDLEITAGPTVPVMTVSLNGKTLINGATVTRGSILDIAVDFTSVTSVTSAKLFIRDESGRETELTSSATAILTYSLDTTNDLTGKYTLRAVGSGSERDFEELFEYTLSEVQIP